MHYIPPAAPVDVAFEQLAYLLAHPQYCQAVKGCPLCQRLDQVNEILMLPFRPKPARKRKSP